MTLTSSTPEGIDPSVISGFILLRSPAERFKYNVMAVDEEGEFLFCAASDLTFEKASDMMQAINNPYVKDQEDEYESKSKEAT